MIQDTKTEKKNKAVTEARAELEEAIAYTQAVYFYDLFQRCFEHYTYICYCGYWREEPEKEPILN